MASSLQIGRWSSALKLRYLKWFRLGSHRWDLENKYSHRVNQLCADPDRAHFLTLGLAGTFITFMNSWLCQISIHFALNPSTYFIECAIDNKIELDKHTLLLLRHHDDRCRCLLMHVFVFWSVPFTFHFAICARCCLFVCIYKVRLCSPHAAQRARNIVIKLHVLIYKIF